MKSTLLVMLAVIAATALAANATPMLQVITPIAADTAAGSEACHLNQSFDNQPVWDGTKPVNTTITGADSNVYTNRWGYMDFGANWQDVRIYQLWQWRYRQWSGGNDQTLFEGGFWTMTNPATSVQVPAAITETRIKFSNQSFLPYANEVRWLQDADFSGAPLALGGRYLVLHSLNPVPANPDARASEFAFVGTVPEPASMCLLGLGAVALIRRR